jgi:YjzC-like protein
MAKVGDRFKTGQKCDTKGSYVFDGYTDGTTTPAPTNDERVIPLSSGETFPPIKSTGKGAWWRLQRIG